MSLITLDKKSFREVVYQSVGAGTGVLLRDHPDYEFPSENVIDAVEHVLEELCPDAGDRLALDGIESARAWQE